MQIQKMGAIVICFGSFLALGPKLPHTAYAVAKLRIAAGPWLQGSHIPLQPQGLAPKYRAILLGPGRIIGGAYIAPNVAKSTITTVVASDGHALASARITIAAPPAPNETLLAVASYDDGIALHDAKTFALVGILATNGRPSDVATTQTGMLVATDTDGTTALVLKRAPWSIARIANVPFGDEIAYDASTQAFFITNRYDGTGGSLTRIDAASHTTSVRIGDTPEGIIIDAQHHRAYAANTNAGTVSVVNTRTMHVILTFPAVPRVFGLSLSSDGKTLYAVANQSRTSPFEHNGFVAAFHVLTAKPHLFARSAALDFPIGIVADGAHNQVFVTDEASNRIDVLDGRTLKPQHAPLATCTTPWKPSIAKGRLYIPCARANAIDVFDVATLRRVRGAPFPTAGYPLAVKLWPGNV